MKNRTSNLSICLFCRLWTRSRTNTISNSLFTDNHSTDRTFRVLEQLARHDTRVRVIRFARNFGFQRSVFTAYLNARGDAAVQIDCDLQDPPSLIPEFISKWEEGYRVVYGIRTSRRESWWMNTIRKLFYRLVDSLSEDPLPLDAGDFRLVDRCVLDELQKFEDYQPYLRGTIATLGFDQIGISYDRAERTRGTSKFSFRELMGLALDGILNHSVVPLPCDLSKGWESLRLQYLLSAVMCLGVCS